MMGGASVARRTFGLGLASALLLRSARAKAASDEDLARLIIDGRLDDALQVADGALGERQGSSSLSLMAGALRFVYGDYSGARQIVASAEATGGYLMGGPLDMDVLRTNVMADDWAHLASLRAGEVSSEPSGTFWGLLSGKIGVDAYVAQRAALERAFYDSLVLSIASSPGRTRFLDSMESQARSVHFCSAHFVLAEAALAEGRRADAVASLRMATATAQPRLLEYHIAKMELARLD